MESKGNTSLGLNLRQNCGFQRIVSYVHATLGPLISEINYPASSISKYNF